MAKKKKKKSKSKKKAPAQRKGVAHVGKLRGKTKEVSIIVGKTTVAEALRKAEITIPSGQTAKQKNWRLNGYDCEWTTVINKTPTDLYQVPDADGGS